MPSFHCWWLPWFNYTASGQESNERESVFLFPKRGESESAFLYCCQFTNHWTLSSLLIFIFFPLLLVTIFILSRHPHQHNIPFLVSLRTDSNDWERGMVMFDVCSGFGNELLHCIPMEGKQKLVTFPHTFPDGALIYFLWLITLIIYFTVLHSSDNYNYGIICMDRPLTLFPRFL